MAENQSFQLKIISPDREFYSGDCEFLEFTAVTGQMGVYAEHIPLTTILVPCVMTIHEASQVRKAVVTGGFIEIQKREIRVLAEDAQWPEDIDAKRAKEAQERAKMRLESNGEDVDVKRAELALKRALARLQAVSSVE